MNALDRYLTRTVLGFVALVMSVLVVLGTLFQFIDQQSDIGTGSYGVVDALLFSLLNAPQFALQALPAGALIGAMLGVGSLARSHEITAMRAGGMGKWRLAGALLGAGAILILIALVLGEWLAPRLQQLASERKTRSQFDLASISADSAWLRDGALIINVERSRRADQYGTMLVFELEAEHRLAAVGRAERTATGANGEWRLSQYQESRFDGERVSARTMEERSLGTARGAEFLQVAAQDVSDLSLAALYRVIGYRRANGQESASYEFALWSRVARTLTLAAAVLFALPFGFGTMRSAGAGARTLLGLGIGVFYFLLLRMVESGTLVFGLPPLLLAWLPTLLLATATGVLLQRAR